MPYAKPIVTLNALATAPLALVACMRSALDARRLPTLDARIPAPACAGASRA